MESHIRGVRKTAELFQLCCAQPGVLQAYSSRAQQLLGSCFEPRTPPERKNIHGTRNGTSRRCLLGIYATDARSCDELSSSVSPEVRHILLGACPDFASRSRALALQSPLAPDSPVYAARIRTVRTR
eukprot:1182250-Prorocentrum_minimum.AAC.3